MQCRQVKPPPGKLLKSILYQLMIKIKGLAKAYTCLSAKPKPSGLVCKAISYEMVVDLVYHGLARAHWPLLKLKP